MGRLTSKQDHPQASTSHSSDNSRRILLLPHEPKINREITINLNSRPDSMALRRAKAHSTHRLECPAAAPTLVQRRSSLPRAQWQMGVLGSSSFLEQLESSLSLSRKRSRLTCKNQHRRGEQQHDQIHITNQLVTYN